MKYNLERRRKEAEEEDDCLYDQGSNQACDAKAFLPL
jgi:hypothetical protein